VARADSAHRRASGQSVSARQRRQPRCECGGIVDARPPAAIPEAAARRRRTLADRTEAAVSPDGAVAGADPQYAGLGAVPPGLCPGARIATPGGAVAIEALSAGDLVTTPEGPRRIRWVGLRQLRPGLLPEADRAAVRPLRLRRGAFGPGRPDRDLLASPSLDLVPEGAAVALAELDDGKLVGPAPLPEVLTYIHLELEGGGIFLANGLAVSAYTDRGERNVFAGVASWPGPAAQASPPAAGGDAIAELRAALAGRAKLLEPRFTNDPAVRLLVDGREVPPSRVIPGGFAFDLQAPAGEIRLLSRSMVPALVEPGALDRRHLGVALRRMRLRSQFATLDVCHDHPAFRQGFYAAEEKHRWTDGYALVPPALLAPITDDFTLDVDIVRLPSRYPLEPEGGGPRAVVIDATTPTPDRDAGSNVMLEHMRLLQALGYDVTFVPEDNFAEIGGYTQALLDEGIEVIRRPEYSRLDHFLAMRGRGFSLAYVHRSAVAEHALPLLHRFAPQAPVLFNPGHQAPAADATLLGAAAEREALAREVPGAVLHVLPWPVEAGLARLRAILSDLRPPAPVPAG
jgi:hypothetical protein